MDGSDIKSIICTLSLLCAYAVMSNHVHFVLRVVKKKAKGWENFELARRWDKLYGLPQAVSAALAGGASTADVRFPIVRSKF